MLLLLQSTGAQILPPDDHSSMPTSIPRCVRVHPPTSAPLLPMNRSSAACAGICLLGPLLTRFGSATIPLPGGCRIGPRPIDLHLRGLAALGANLKVTDGWVHALR
jgi:UDP-N-acetylglucosamine 1-carboxyvinyltransferase